MKPIEGQANGISLNSYPSPTHILLLLLFVNFSFRFCSSLHLLPAPYFRVGISFGKHSESL